MFVVLKPKLAPEQREECWERMPSIHKDPAIVLLLATVVATTFWAVLVFI
jgi:hypothetical protein